jgi:hypothetical protein
MEYEHFEESGINFTFPSKRLFRIEKSITLEEVNHGSGKNEGIKTVEFLFLDKENDSVIIWIVEAKTGTPQPAKEADYQSFINNIKDKFCDSFHLFLAIYLKRHTEELPIDFQEIDLKSIQFKFVLIITSNTYKERWLEPLRDDINKILKKMVKIWKFPPDTIMVINPATAKQLKLIDNQS